MGFWKQLFGIPDLPSTSKKCQRCGKAGRPPKPPAVYGEPLPFRIRAADTGREVCYWLCSDCYTQSSLELKEKGSVTIIAGAEVVGTEAKSTAPKPASATSQSDILSDPFRLEKDLIRQDAYEAYEAYRRGSRRR